MKRLTDWEPRLSGYLAWANKQTFKYGRFDCCLFVSGAIEAMTGVDVSTGLKDSYSTLEQAEDAMITFVGYRSMPLMAEFVLGRSGIHTCPMSFAQRGAPVLIRMRKEFSLGLMDLNARYALVAADKGLLRFDLKYAVKAWKI